MISFLLIYMATLRFDLLLDIFYVTIFGYILIAGSIRFIKKSGFIEKWIVTIVLVLLIIFSNVSVLTSKKNAIIDNDYPGYNRLNHIQNSQSTLNAYYLMADKDYIIYTQYPDIFFRFVLKDTNNTVLDLVDLKNSIMKKTFETESRPKFIHANIGDSCNPNDIAQWVNKTMGFLVANTPELYGLEYQEFIQKLNNIESKKFIKIGWELLCEIN